MKLKEDQNRIKELLRDTITLLCKNGLHYKGGFSVEALIGITLDEDDVFLVSIKESVQTESAKKSSSGVDVQVRRRHTTEGSESEHESCSPQKKDRPNRKRPPNSPAGLDQPSPSKAFKMHSDPDDNSDASSATANYTTDTHKEFNIKSEPIDDDELVFVKQEGSTAFSSSCAQNETAFTFGSPNPNSSQLSMTPHMVNQNYSFDSPTGGNASASNIPGIASWASSQPVNSSNPAISSQGSQQQVNLESRGSGLMCHLCSSEYKDKRNLKGHLLRTHGIGTPMTCLCGQSFAWNPTYYTHRKTCPVVLKVNSGNND